MKIIGFCGLPGAGKTTAIEAIEDLGKIVTMGDVIRRELINRDIELTDDNLGIIAKELRNKGGDEIIAEKCLELIDTCCQSENVFIDGIRSKAEVDVFKRRGKFPVIAVETSLNLRHKRIADRARSDDSNEVSEIKERDLREIGFGLNEVIKDADFHIYNEGNVEELKMQTRKIVLEILQSYFE